MIVMMFGFCFFLSVVVDDVLESRDKIKTRKMKDEVWSKGTRNGSFC